MPVTKQQANKILEMALRLVLALLILSCLWGNDVEKNYISKFAWNR